MFINETFLLQSETARELYFDYAEPLPIIDFHNHLPPEDLANNRQFSNITEAWLEDDHYKWRAMRTWGVDESFCTGKASALDKFTQWASVVPYTVGNPLFHWTHMELSNPFGISQLLNSDTADSIYHQTNALLATPEFNTQGLLKQRKVEVVCTTDDPTSSLQYHQLAKTSCPDLAVLPTFRIDGLLCVDDANQFCNMVSRLEVSANSTIDILADFYDALQQRHEAFHQMGCRLSDIGISDFAFVEPRAAEAEAAFRKIGQGQPLDVEQQQQLYSAILIFVSQLNARRGWVQQLHIGALRDANRRKVAALGHGRGFDSIGSYNNTLSLRQYLDSLSGRDQLAKTILYNLNPADNEVFSTMASNFNEGDCRGKVQHGAAWWFLDQKQGIEQHLLSVSSLSLLSCFVGMVTDSRSFLSFSRHEYFRRILCNFIGDHVESGLMPKDINLLGDIVNRICYGNAKAFFPFKTN